MSGPLTPDQVAEALREAVWVARGDRDHDVRTVLDVLARDHRPDLRGPWVQQQLADTIADFTHGDRGALIEAARNWCRANKAALPQLFEAAADAVDGALERAAA